MKDLIIKLREELVKLSSNPIKTRELLDQLTAEEIERHDSEAHYLVGKNDIVETKDFDFFAVYKTRKGYALRYKGGYNIFVDSKLNLRMPCEMLEYLMTDSENEEDKLTKTAVEMIFRLPLFIFSHADTMFTIATMATQYLILLQKKSAVPTKDTENKEFDEFIFQLNEWAEKLAIALEKEGKEYERRMGYAEVKEESESQNESQGETEQKGA